MITRQHSLALLVTPIFFVSGCKTLWNTNDKFFTLKDSYYQSWMINNNDKGTNLFLELADIKPGVVFDSVIFRGVKLPVFIEEKDGVTKLKGILYRDLDIFLKEQEVSNLPDQLIYHYHDKRYTFRLENIRRINMKYYKK